MTDIWTIKFRLAQTILHNIRRLLAAIGDTSGVQPDTVGRWACGSSQYGSRDEGFREEIATILDRLPDALKQPILSESATEEESALAAEYFCEAITSEFMNRGAREAETFLKEQMTKYPDRVDFNLEKEEALSPVSSETIDAWRHLILEEKRSLLKATIRIHQIQELLKKFVKKDEQSDGLSSWDVPWQFRNYR